METEELQSGLLEDNVRRSTYGGWRSASLLLGAGILERFAYYGIESNLVNYLTGPLGESVAASAANVNTWTGVVSLAPLPESFFADAFIGRYRTIIITSLLYILGLGLMTFTAVLISFNNGISRVSGMNTALVISFYISIYLIALAQVFKTCVQSFGADQFYVNDPQKKGTMSSFFNWWLFGLCTGGLIAHLTLTYIQENINWGIGFGIPCLAMFVGLMIILVGSRIYHFPMRGDHDDDRPAGDTSSLAFNKFMGSEDQLPESSQNLKFLNHIWPEKDTTNAKKNSRWCCGSRNDRAIKIGKLILIWTTCLAYAIGYAQAPTLFTKQASTMDLSIGKSFEVPSATLRMVIPLAILLSITFYDRVFVPIARKITGKARGITMLQRMGTGMAVSMFDMVIAALVEKKRLETAQEYGLVNIPNAMVPMSFWWLIPQYIIHGMAACLFEVGMQEFFYDQVSSELKSVGLSFYQGAIGIGSFLSSLLISVTQELTSQDGKDGWFCDNLNRAHIDYFYWLIAGLSAFAIAAFIVLAATYDYVDEKALCVDSDR